VQAHGVVVLDEAGDEAAGLFDIERGAGSEAMGFERFVPAFDLADGLEVETRKNTKRAVERIEIAG
jgi:hypothetical protein